MGTHRSALRFRTMVGTGAGEWGKPQDAGQIWLDGLRGEL